MIKKRRRYIFIFTVLMVFLTTDVSGKSILFTRHNLSVSGLGPITAASEDRICVFCHMPPFQKMSSTFLWNRKSTTSTYTPYHSSTLHAKVGQPTGASRICLSCHDGTIALGALISEPKEVPFKGGIRFMQSPQPSKLGTDLTDDHPVSLVYDTKLALENQELREPSFLPKEVQLDGSGYLQCTACHNPHKDPYGNFLVMPNHYSVLCTTCHEKDGWRRSTHALTETPLNRKGNLWPNTDYQTVAKNGCENCHRPHTAGTHERLLNHTFEEDNCLSCHNGNISAPNIELGITMPFKHSVQDYIGMHDPAENFASGNIPAHVECQDCHNPHQVNGDESPDGSQVSGAITGVKGVSEDGQQVEKAHYLYEVCYKCHGDNNVLSAFPITRQIDQLNTREEFASVNPSFHPVGSPGRNPEVPSLLPPYTVNSIISCIDCHNSSDPNGPNGPHGSDFKYILERNYETDDSTQESSYSYALCYKCHNRDSILNDQSFRRFDGRNGHRGHIVDEKTPCSVCHDPHGVSISQGSSQKNSHLINFDLEIVQPNSLGDLYFNDNGMFGGECHLSCHGMDHGPKEYPRDSP